MKSDIIFCLKRKKRSRMHLVNHTEEQQDYFSLLPLKTESNLVKANCFISVDLCQCAPAAAGHSLGFLG